jgi:hypothetical protein
MTRMTDSAPTAWRVAAGALLLALAAAGAPGGAAPPAVAETAVADIAIERTGFTVRLADGRRLSGRALVGRELVVAVGGEGRMAVRIDAVEPDPRDRSGETTLYALSVAGARTGARRSLCAPDPYGERWGFPLAAAYGADGHATGPFAITCTAGAQAKCIRFGYRPWHPEMVDLHAACVRMVRADYCGDGKPHTRNGTRISLWDRRGILPAGDPWPGLGFEAAWSPEGAVCVARTRLPEVATLDQVLAECPRLRSAGNGSACTEASAPGAILFNKSF